MLANRPTLADLRKAGKVSSAEIVAAVDLFMRDPDTPPYRFKSGYTLDVPGVIAASSNIATARLTPGPQEKALRVAITSSLMQSYPVPL